MSEFETREDLRPTFEKIMKVFEEDKVGAWGGIQALSPVLTYLLCHIKDKPKRKERLNEFIESVHNMLKINDGLFDDE